SPDEPPGEHGPARGPQDAARDPTENCDDASERRDPDRPVRLFDRALRPPEGRVMKDDPGRSPADHPDQNPPDRGPYECPSHDADTWQVCFLTHPLHVPASSRA